MIITSLNPQMQQTKVIRTLNHQLPILKSSTRDIRSTHKATISA